MWSKISKRRRRRRGGGERERESKRGRGGRGIHFCTSAWKHPFFFRSVQIFKLEVLTDHMKKEMFKCHAVYSDTDYTFTSLILL